MHALRLLGRWVGEQEQPVEPAAFAVGASRQLFFVAAPAVVVVVAGGARRSFVAIVALG